MFDLFMSVNPRRNARRTRWQRIAVQWRWLRAWRSPGQRLVLVTSEHFDFDHIRREIRGEYIDIEPIRRDMLEEGNDG